MSLKKDLIASGAIVFTAKKVVEAHVEQRRRRSIGRKMPSNAFIVLVCPRDHHDGVPAFQPPYSLFHLLVAGKSRLLLRRDGIDIGSLHKLGTPRLSVRARCIKMRTRERAR